MAHCMETLLEEEKEKTKSSKQPGFHEFRKVYYRKSFHVDDEIFDNDLHKPTGGTGKSQWQEGPSDQESRSDDGTDTTHILKLMDIVTGTPAMVKLRQDYCREHDDLLSTDILSILFTGSKAEGLDLPGSDQDFMHEIRKVKVVQGTHTDCHPDDDFLIVPSQSNSCFVLLKLVGRSLCNEDSLMMSQQIDHDIFLSSLLFTLNTLKRGSFFKSLHKSSQGPSLEVVYGVFSYDHVKCFKCSSWPETCDEWIRRERQHNWPDDSLKRKIIQSGFHLVPIGHPLSSQREMEWRVSFSFAERELVWSFNHIQMHCYAFLKIVLKEYIKPCFLQLSTHDMPLCSYFLKTLMFWAIEETEPSFWEPENLTGCFRYLFCTLHKHVISGHLSHYFMPDFNLFEIKVKGEAQQAVIMILDSISDLEIEGVMNTSDTLCKASIEVSHSNIRTSGNDVFQCIKTFSGLIPLLIFQTLMYFNIVSRYKYDVIVRFLCRSIKTEIKEVLSKWMVSYLCYTDEFGIRSSANKSLYKILHIHKMENLEYDLTSTRLLYATRLLLQKDFNACLTIINHMFSSIPPYAVYFGNDHTRNKSKVIELFKNISCKENLNMSQILSQGIILDLVFSKHQIDFLPAAVQIELKCSGVFGIVHISPYVYSYYLMFLCYHGLGDVKGRESALRMLIDAATDERGGQCRHHSLNIAGHCWWLLGQYDEARITFMVSEKISSDSILEEYNSCHLYLRLLDISKLQRAT